MRRFLLSASLVVLVLLLAACGNKGPLVRASAGTNPAPAATVPASPATSPTPAATVPAPAASTPADWQP